MPHVSVIIPTYKHSEYILETLGSVFSQTFTDYEVIVVNDGSPDDTDQVLRPLIGDGRIKYVHQSNAGQAAARNAGLAQTNGKYIAFLDDDDVWPGNKLEWQVEALESNPSVEAVSGRAQFIGPSGKRLDYVSDWKTQLEFTELFRGNPIISPGQTLVRASTIERVGGLDPTIWGADDWDLWFKIARTGPISMQDRIALYYRVHPSNATKQGRRLYLGSRLTVERQLSTLDPTTRMEMRRHAYSFLFEAWASLLISNAKEAIRLGQLREAVKNTIALSLLLRAILVLPSLPARLFMKLIPVRGGRAAAKITGLLLQTKK